MKRINLIPAYGRTYVNKAEVIAAINENRDFVVADMSCQWDGMNCNKTDLIDQGYTDLQIRYGKGNTKVMVHKLTA